MLGPIERKDPSNRSVKGVTKKHGYLYVKCSFNGCIRNLQCFFLLSSIGREPAAVLSLKFRYPISRCLSGLLSTEMKCRGTSIISSLKTIKGP